MQKRYIAKIISIILCIICCVSTICANDIYSGDYLDFNNPYSKMNSDGTFTFGIALSVTSDSFTANKAYVTIGTTAHVYDRSNQSEFNSDDDDYSYTVSLYTYYTSNRIGSYTGYADGTKYGQSYATTTGTKYYIKISANNPNLKLTQYEIEGDGYVKNVTVN